VYFLVPRGVLLLSSTPPAPRLPPNEAAGYCLLINRNWETQPTDLLLRASGSSHLSRSHLGEGSKPWGAIPLRRRKSAAPICRPPLPKREDSPAARGRPRATLQPPAPPRAPPLGRRETSSAATYRSSTVMPYATAVTSGPR
jgi:hypothetical protein